jgi:hypothetical protein
MKDRINSPHRYPGYAHLDYDKEWGTFDGFLKDMGNSWSEKLTLDRIDNSKGYSKENCRWATKSIQAMNQRRNKKHTYNGKEYFLKELSDLSGIKYGVLRDRLNKLGWSVELALSVPSNSRGGVGITKKLKYDLSNKKLG